MYNSYLKPVLFLLLLQASNLNGQQVDTLNSYTAVNIYSGDSDTIYIDHPRYYGLFTKSDCLEGDNATKILSKNHCYRRVFNNYAPRFIEIGSNSPLPILGGTIVEEADAINAVAYLAYIYGGDTIEIDKMYEIDRSIFLFDNISFLGIAEGAGFVRSKPPVTRLARDAKNGEDKFIVESTEGFRKLHSINIFSGKGYDELSSFTSYTGSISSFLGGDSTIFLSGLKVQKPMNTGDTVSLLYPMMTPLFGSTNNVLIKNLIFDGNRTENNFSYDWRVATTIVTPSSENLVIEDCTFNQIVSENMFICGAKLLNCKGDGFNGSVVHFSCLDGDYRTEVLYNNFLNTNEIGDSIMEHSEAAMTYSAKVRNLLVAYNNVDKIMERGIGIFANDDYNIEVTDNILNSTKESISYQAFYDRDSTNLVYNNKNKNFLNKTADNCIPRIPLLTENLMCNAGSNSDNPLGIGDTVTIVFDSIKVINSNGNFLKCIEPHYLQEYFTLTSTRLALSKMSKQHRWINSIDQNLCDGLVFDNGHRDGIFTPGNWGYELCESGECNLLELRFVVTDLPELGLTVDCPLKKLILKFDGELGTWDEEILCSNSTIEFGEELGQPYLKGLTSKAKEVHNKFIISPNPVDDTISILNPKKSELQYCIVSQDGKVIVKGTTYDTIGVNKLPSGLYFLSLVNDDFIMNSSFVKI